MSEEFLSYPAPKERPDLQEQLVKAKYFLRYDKDGNLELWTWTSEADNPVSTNKRFATVEDAYARVFRDGPDPKNEQ